MDPVTATVAVALIGAVAAAAAIWWGLAKAARGMATGEDPAELAAWAEARFTGEPTVVVQETIGDPPAAAISPSA